MMAEREETVTGEGTEEQLMMAEREEKKGQRNSRWQKEKKQRLR